MLKGLTVKLGVLVVFVCGFFFSFRLVFDIKRISLSPTHNLLNHYIGGLNKEGQGLLFFNKSPVNFYLH